MAHAFIELVSELFAVPFTQGAQTDKSFLVFSFECRLLSILELESHISKSLNEILKTLGLLFEYRVDSFTKLVTLGSLFRENRSFLTLPVRLRCDDRKPMLRKNTVTQFLYCQTRKEEVIELPGAINGRGIINDMIVYMGFVNVGCHNKSVFALRPAHRRFIADLIIRIALKATIILTFPKYTPVMLVQG